MLKMFFKSQKRKILRLAYRAGCDSRLDDISNVDGALDRGSGLGRRDGVVSSGRNGNSVGDSS